MMHRTIFGVLALCCALILVAGLSHPHPPAHAAPALAPPTDPGIPVTSDVVIRSCGACHQVDDEGRMSRISYMRKTPEGWQASLQRMVALQDLRIDPETAREVVRYLSNAQGLAPEELRPALFHVERRMVEFTYPDENVTETCAACHSMGMAITQRRSAEEWSLLAETHRGYYPRVDGQRFRRGGGSEGEFPVDRAVEHLADAYPLETASWSEWTANTRPARLEGSWALEGWEPGRGPVFGRVEVEAVEGTDDEFTTRITYTRPQDGGTFSRQGRGIVYTGFQWRGRSSDPRAEAEQDPARTGVAGELREVMFVERDWRTIHGRWFTGPHDEFGMDVRLHRIEGRPVVTGVHPAAVQRGSGEVELRIFGAELPSEPSTADVDLGPGVEVAEVLGAHSDSLIVRIRLDPEARVGQRDLRLRGAPLTRALAIYDRVHYLRVEPSAGMARVGGIAAPKQYQQFEAIGYHAGPDGEVGTDDDLRLGPLPVSWDLLEYPVTFEDDDVEFVGRIDDRGLFTPAVDGINPERAGDRNNMGDVWVRATYSPPDGEGSELEARAYLVVTAPVYIRWDSWTVDGETVP